MSVINDLSITESILFWRGKRFCSIDEFSKSLHNIQTTGVDARVIKVIDDRERAIFKLAEGGLVVANFNEIKSHIDKYEIQVKEREAKADLLERMSKKSSIEDLHNLFNEDMDMIEYYYYNIAFEGNLSCAVCHDLFKSLNAKYRNAQVVIESCLLINKGVLSRDKVNTCLKQINKKTDIELVKDILTAHGVKYRVESNKIDVEEYFRKSINASYLCPLFLSVYTLPKTKASKEIAGLDDVLNSDYNLKYLKVLNLLDTSRSVKLVTSSYNAILAEIGRIFNKDLFYLQLKDVKSTRYNNNFKASMKIMKEVVQDTMHCLRQGKEITSSIEMMAISLQDKV